MFTALPRSPRRARRLFRCAIVAGCLLALAGCVVYPDGPGAYGPRPGYYGSYGYGYYGHPHWR